MPNTAASGGVSYGDHFFRCWVAEKHYTHGTIGLADAIKVSCDSFFYQYGNAAGIQSIDAVGKMLGIGEESGLHLSGEQTGNMPGPEWMQIHHPRERWSSAQTANVSIGQGYTLVSPLQLAMAYAAAANGGTCYYPRLIDKVLESGRHARCRRKRQTSQFRAAHSCRSSRRSLTAGPRTR